WDCLNRMTGYTNGTSSITNTYRADGMRVEKASTLNPSVHTDYGYDGQMTIEEYNYRNTYPASSPIKLIRYGIGARGVDWIERTDATTSVVTTGYPIYDAHGNMVATLEKGSSLDTYVINDQRNYDAWGGIIKGNTSGEPNGRYCANLGHLQDDESGFVYMQARYYDASCGRFLSQDKGRSGSNWFLYCKNDPANRLDRTGQIDYVDLYHVFYQASDEFLQGLWEAAQEAADSSDPSIIAEYIAENWNAEVLQFSKGAVWRGLRGTTVRLTVEAEELEAQGFSVDMSKVLEVQNEMAEVGRLIGVAEEVQVFDFE
ncbi:MAG TPA: RHS repeat-associated core domain-containing protein, partial [Fimbriimonadaceae bacterium]|nr:RHS repeat-associated core domain-containing protein [Fimbriimonadaceae bacterium]